MTVYFRVTAKGLIYDGQKVLLIRKPIGVWDLPGGRLDDGEDPESALRREIREELGVDAEIGRLADCTVRARESSVSVVVVSYHCSINATLGDIRLSEEHTEAQYFPVSEISFLDMHDAYKTAIERGADGHHGSSISAPAARARSRALSFLTRTKILGAS